jgi:16S rRNA (adenine1518-N6/adenine1519-N6)-dimethyltransferase
MSEAHKVRLLLRKFGLRPSKRLGQNFLHDLRSLRRVVEVAELGSDEAVLEVGAGIGNLTMALAGKAKKVWAVEIDRRFEGLLQQAVVEAPNVQLIFGDVLEIDLEQLTRGTPFKVVSNIPYQITSVLLRRLLEMRHPPIRIVFTVQEQVADRIIAPPGELSLLAVSVLAYGTPTKLDRIPADLFYPVPQVDSAILRIDIHEAALLSPDNVPEFFRIVKAGFEQRRKQLQNSLAKGLGSEKEQVAGWLRATGISPRARAQELSFDDWMQLVEVIRASVPGR